MSVLLLGGRGGTERDLPVDHGQVKEVVFNI